MSSKLESLKSTLVQRAISTRNSKVRNQAGSPVRDFVHASDVARAMMFVMKNGIDKPVNVSSGNPTSIRELVELISRCFDNAKFEFTASGISGDNKRLMDVTRLTNYGWEPKTSLQNGLKDTIEWFKSEGHKGYERYNSFKEEN